MKSYRIVCPPEIRHNQIIALETDDLIILRQNGPLAFTVQDIHREKPFEVRLGDPHTCSCRCYKLSQDLCSHICWIVLKKFKISYTDTLSYQRGITDIELDALYAQKRRRPRLTKIHTAAVPVPRRRPTVDDTCAVCLDPFDHDDSVTHCKYTCGNIVHVRCIRMMMQHEQPSDILKCPMCRGTFDTVKNLRRIITKESRRPKLHAHDIQCTFCRRKPILGRIYRCLECHRIILCGRCLETQDFRIYHATHQYAVKKKSAGPWRRLGKVEEHLKAFNRNGNFLLSSTSANDGNAAKKNLLEFSKGFSFNWNQSQTETYKNKTNVIKTDRNFVKRNYLCAVCTDAFEANTNILATACGHYFHSDCMEEHLNDSINEKRCPLDNIQIHYSPSKPKQKVIESKTREEINLGPLEVRVSRMHLEERPKESKCFIVNTNTTKSNTKHKQRIKNHKDKPANIHDRAPSLDERVLSTRVNPLMTILMSPHLKQFIEQEEKRDQAKDANTKRKSLNKIKVKSLEFPDEYNTRKLHKTQSTVSSSHWLQKTLKYKTTGD